MNWVSRGATTVLVSFVLLLIPARKEARAQSGGGRSGVAQSPPARGQVQRTEEVYKNIQVLQGVPADQLNPTMRLITTSLGVQCTFCHVPGAEDKDDKQEKQTARRMMQMVLAINKDSFDGRVQVTCYTCHRGSPSPVGTPVIVEGSMRPRGVPAGGPAPSPMPSAEQLLDKYLQAIGGMDAINRISTRVATGKSQEAGSIPYPLEVYVKSPDKRLTVVRMPGNISAAGYSGNAGWTASAALNVNDMSAADLEGAKLEDDLYLAAHLQQIYTQWSVGRPEKVGDRDAYVLDGTASGRVPIRLYLDQQTGMLLRMTYFTELPLGRLPTQLDYADYRDVEGVKVPFRITAVRATSRTTIQLSQVQQNGPIEDSQFSKPAAPPTQ